MMIAVASDHGGYDLRLVVKEHLIERGFDVNILTFEDALNSALHDVQPVITADLTKETKKSK